MLHLAHQGVAGMDFLPSGFMPLQVVLSHAGRRVAHKTLNLLDLPASLAEESSAEAAYLMEAWRVRSGDSSCLTRILEGSSQLLGHYLGVV